MSNATEKGLLEAVLDSWDRNNRILVNLLNAVPEGGLEVRPIKDSPSVGELFGHIHHVRLIFLSEDAPEFAGELPDSEWKSEPNRDLMTQKLNQSASAVRKAVKSKVDTGQDMNEHFDHPILFLQHMIWHEGYHHGQIKLALKLAGLPISNKVAGPISWRVWMNKT